MSARLIARDEFTGEIVRKSDARKWAARIREDLRDFDAAMKSGDYSQATQWAMDAAGAASELQRVAEAYAAAIGGE